MSPARENNRCRGLRLLLPFVFCSVLLGCRLDGPNNFEIIHQKGTAIQSNINRGIEFAAFSDEVQKMAADISSASDKPMSAKGEALLEAYQSALDVMQDTVKLWNPKRTDYVRNDDEIELGVREPFDDYPYSLWHTIDKYDLQPRLVRIVFGAGIYNLPVTDAVQKLLGLSAARLDTANRMYANTFVR